MDNNIIQKDPISNITIKPLTKINLDDNDDIKEPLPNFKTRSNFIMSIIAPTGSGKSVLISNLIRVYYKNIFDKIYFCSSNVADDLKIYDNAYNSLKFDDKRIFNTINNEIINYIKLDIETDEDFDKKDFKTLLIIDDLITEVANKKNKDLINFILKSRHLKTSIIIISHKYNFLPSVIRNNLTHIILFRSKSKLELDTIYKGIIDVDDDEFYKIYNDATNEQHNFLYIVLNKNPQQYYHNFNYRYRIS